MTPRFLLDTHVIVWWLSNVRKLSREQARVLGESVRRREPVAVSGMSLLEIAVFFDRGRPRRGLSVAEVLGEIGSNPIFQVLPLTIEVANEVLALGPSLRDPGDRAIVATARVNRLQLITSDERIIDSGLVSVVW